MSNVISSTIFCVRNTNKVEQGEVGRVPVAVGQARNVVNSVMSLDHAIGKTAKTAVESLIIASENEALLKYAGKAVNFVGKNINPLICASAGIKVLASDDKTSTAIQQASALSGMFAVEKLMKKHMDEIPKMKYLNKITEKVLEIATKHKFEGKLPALIHGVLFVVGSCFGYSLGEKFGTGIAKEVKGV